jgi:sterol desaturase/sphingolipid hydroxylase (fatty acid hydroxylase superfamily)
MIHMRNDLRMQAGGAAADSQGTVDTPTRRALRAITESRTNYGLSYAIDFACPVALCWQGSRGSSDWTTASLAFCVGAALFSFVEYALHRWFFHARGTFVAAMHRAHHRSPADPMALPCFSSAAVSLGLWWLLTPLPGHDVASFFLGGILSGYFVYATLHHVHHSTRRTAVPLRWLRKSWITHALHHSCPDKNFGVTTSLWDRVFGTYQERGKGSAGPRDRPISFRRSSSSHATHRERRKPLSSLPHPRRTSS